MTKYALILANSVTLGIPHPSSRRETDPHWSIIPFASSETDLA